MTDNSTPPQWAADPYGLARLRFWDGQRWTEHTDGSPGAPNRDTPQTRKVLLWLAVPLVLFLLIVGFLVFTFGVTRHPGAGPYVKLAETVSMPAGWQAGDPQISGFDDDNYLTCGDACEVGTGSVRRTWTLPAGTTLGDAEQAVNDALKTDMGWSSPLPEYTSGDAEAVCGSVVYRGGFHVIPPPDGSVTTPDIADSFTLTVSPHISRSYDAACTP